MAFNSGFAAGSGVENFYDTSVDFGKLSGAAAVQRAMEELNAIKRNSGTFNAIMGADSKAEIEKLYGEGQQAMHDAKMFNSYLNTGAQLVGGGISAFGKAGGFGEKQYVTTYDHTDPVNIGGTSYPMMNPIDNTDYNFDARFDY
jgi:hypothetical protein